MKILLVMVIVLLAVFLVLWQKIKISYEFTAENLDICAKTNITWCGKKLFASGGEKPKKNSGSEKNKNSAMKLSDIIVIKDAVLAAICPVLRIIKRSVNLLEFETDVKLALPDPMENGIAYGAVCGVLNVFYAGIMRIYPGRKYFLDIEHDFKSGEGVNLINKGKLYVRPCKVLVWAIAELISNKRLRNALRDIKKLSSKEDKNK